MTAEYIQVAKPDAAFKTSVQRADGVHETITADSLWELMTRKLIVGWGQPTVLQEVCMFVARSEVEASGSANTRQPVMDGRRRPDGDPSKEYTDDE
jgi:hypothetical protein